MTQIIFPLKPRMQGPEVGDLQAVLQLLLDRGVILANDESARRELMDALHRERAEQTYGSVTRNLVDIFQEERRLERHGTVDEMTAKALDALLNELTGPADEQPLYVVKGAVRLNDGFPAAEMAVVAFDRDLRSEQPLGQSRTTQQGLYQIQYYRSRFRDAESGNADVVVKALAADGSVLAVSPTLFHAPPIAELDVTIPADVLPPPTLFERIGRALEPLLGGVPIAELEEDQQHQDLSFLAGETGLDQNVLARFVMAHRLVGEGLPAEFWFALLGDPFFRFAENLSLSQRLAQLLDTLPSLDATAISKSLTRGFNLREISEDLRARVPEWLDAFQRLIASRAVSDSATPTFVKAALEHAGVRNPENQQRIARLFAEYRSLTPEMVKKLEGQRLLTKQQLADLRTSFRLAELTHGDFLTVKVLKETFDIRQPEQIRTLARKSENEWVDLIKAKHAAGEITLPYTMGEAARRTNFPEAEMYGKTLERQFREAFPTTAFAGGLKRALRNGGLPGLQHAETIDQIMERHEDFELLTTAVDEFLDERIHPDLRDRAREPDLRSELKAAQRVFKLAPTFEATTALLADGLHSAQRVYRMGEAEFVQRYAGTAGFTEDSARLTWNRAAETHAAVLTIVGDLKAYEVDTLPRALQSGNKTALGTFPNWNNLFKSGDLCECEHCRSVLGPAAYFADLLMFLKDRYTAVGSVKDLLFQRRPDLGYLELNCQNASTPLPYIDVVCEVLEDVIAEGENDLELVGFTTMPTDPVVAKKTVYAAFSAPGISLGADFSISQVYPGDPDRWVVHGDDVTYLLKKKATPNFFAEILRNTKADSVELRAYPQYVNPKAYAKLRQAKYPLALPFDLFAEEVRAAFQKINLQRWDLMRTLRGTAAPSNPTAIDVAAEYFGISVDSAAAMDEKRLILVGDPTDPGQQAVWGETGNPGWLNTLSNVDHFLLKTGLEYNELLALLDLSFIDPKGDIAIDYRDDPSCDTAKQFIKVLDAEKLDRIHRFLRLWRKLKGWQAWEVDLVLRHSAIGNGKLHEKALINLFYFAQVRKRLGAKATVEQTLGLFGNLNTETRFTKAHEQRADGLYQSLFLNKKLIQPLDLAFAVATVNVLGPTTEKIDDHQPALLAALGIREADLAVLRELTRPSDGLPYITNDLTLTNLSFLWRHAWLSQLLKWKAEDWKAWLTVLGQDIDQFSTPPAALEFLEKTDVLTAIGFTPDELKWLLAADRSAKAAVKEADAAAFLRGLRKDLQAIQAEYDPAQYDFLTAVPPTNEEQLAALLSTLLPKLGRDDAATRYFVAALRGRVVLESKVPGLPAGFAFPTAITGTPNYIPIEHQTANKSFRFTGIMTAAQRTTLLDDASPALTALRASTQLDVTAQLPQGFAFPASITGAPNNIPIQYDAANTRLRFSGLMTDSQLAILLTDASLAAIVTNSAYRTGIEALYRRSLEILTAYRSAIEDLYEQSLTAPASYVTTEVLVTLAGGISLPSALPSIPMRYNAASETLSFTGVMTAAERTALKGVASNPAAAIDELFQLPRLAIKFYQPVFTAPLEVLPPGVDFKTQLPADLAAKISYDAEERVLRFTGIMRQDEQATIKKLVLQASPFKLAYESAVDSLATQPQTIVPPDSRIWLTDADLDDTQSASDTFAKRLANAARRALGYLSSTLTANAVVAQGSAQLGLTEAVTRFLVTRYALPSDTVLTHLTGTFAATTGAVDYAALKTTFDLWFWASRVAAMLKKWKVTLAELERLVTLTANAKLLDFGTLPRDSTASIASIDHFLRTGRLLRLRDSLPEEDISLLEVLANLNSGAYSPEAKVQGLPAGFTFPASITGAPNNIPIEYDEPNKVLRFTALMNAAQRATLLNDPLLSNVTGILSYQQAVEELFQFVPTTFAADVEGVTGTWTSADVLALITSLDLTYPADYLLPESWERLRRAFYFLHSLNAGADTVRAFAASTMTAGHAKTLKELLRSKFGAETWLTLCGEIQDVLRERKRDALAAFLLTQPEPVDAPTGKWENTDDLYAYYLLDVEMSACQPTSRLVQASGSVQLFVQRCFMGLEPAVVVQPDGATGDSAWRWWTWMRKYRVWEANRKVFLWPENWIEPELKKDRSPFFRDMENELLQNEVSQSTAEAAFSSYLEKLDGVSQLELAGFYQEDDGDNTILHVFGRTTGGEPHLYYYRRYDYRQWTPWEKVELDILGDYLIPAVVDRRLFLFWPTFTEVPDEAANTTVRIPKAPGNTESSFTPDKTKKRLRLQMAVSEYRQGAWTPKHVSKAFDESSSYTGEIVSKRYSFFPIDRSEVDGRFFILYQGSSTDRTGTWNEAFLKGQIELSGCGGSQELSFVRYTASALHATRPDAKSTGDDTVSLKWLELKNRQDQPDNDLTLHTNTYLSATSQRTTAVLVKTPDLFRVSPGYHHSYINKLSEQAGTYYTYTTFVTGTWLPFFYNDSKRTFFVLPASKHNISVGQSPGNYYPEIKGSVRSLESFFRGEVDTWVDSFIAMLTPAEQSDLAGWLANQLQLTYVPTTDAQLKAAIKLGPQKAIYSYVRNLADEFLDSLQYHFKNFYHPFVCDFTKLVNNPLKGIAALMSRDNQLRDTGFRFYDVYDPTTAVVESTANTQNPHSRFYPTEEVDFTPDGAYSPYNWELFFHAPLLVANSLSKNQRFEEARDWYHFIFNPLGVESSIAGGSAMSKYWITKPFFQTTDPQYVQQRIDNILLILAGDKNVPGYTETVSAIHQAVFDWRTNPFEPHRIANYRTVAYQKTVIMKYLDNLVAWGDYLFRQDSMESINEATQLYIMAAEILGPRPRTMPPQRKPPDESFNELEYEFDAFSNALVQVENLIPLMSGKGTVATNQPPLPMLYFCIPQNEKMLAHWDTISDRLFKIRHCMNIEGVVRHLPLFEPPIDPGALVKAVAGGVDLSAALTDLSVPLPLYRFNVLLQKANEVCNDVKALGAALLSALEKKDAEALGLLRQSQEIRVLDAVKAVRDKQLEEAKETLGGLQKSKVVTETRRNYYRDIERLISQETLHLDKMGEAHSKAEIAQGITLGASIISYLPAIDLGASGFGGSPIAKFKIGGLELGQAASLASDVLSFLSQIASNDAAMASSKATFDRRWDDWKLQESLADKELEQLDCQIAGANLRIAIAEKEVENHVIQTENAKATDAFMRSKYTDRELYQWQVGQISGVYFQSYKLAYDLAKRAERCFRFELGFQDGSYVNFGYWDSLKKGLLSGEKLQYDLRRLETAYLEQNRREFELTKHVSLRLLDPLALVKLRETGRCFFRLPEEVFDLDYPGHYFRRIKSISLSLPCVVGPYTSVACTLRLVKNSVRVNTANGDNGYPRNVDDQGWPADDGRFVENNIPVKTIAASSAQDDSGVFELSFRDERYLPFEGAGAISEWALELFSDLPSNNPDPAKPDFGKPLRQFDYETISDAILHIKYTAREDAGAFKNGAVAHLRDYFSEDGAVRSLRLFNLRQEFPSQWQRFLHPANPAKGNVLEFEMAPGLFSWKDTEKNLKINTIWLLARGTDPGSYAVVMSPPLPAPPSPPAADPNRMTLTPVNQYGGLHFGQKDVSALGIEVSPTDPPVKWQIKMTRPGGGNLQEDPVRKVMEVEDLTLVLGYEWAS